MTSYIQAQNCHQLMAIKSSKCSAVLWNLFVCNACSVQKLFCAECTDFSLCCSWPVHDYFLQELRDSAHLSLLVTNCKMLTTTMWWGENTHGNTPQDMCTDELTYSLALVATIIHPHILKSSFLRAKCGHLRKKATFNFVLLHILLQHWFHLDFNTFPNNYRNLFF